MVSWRVKANTYFGPYILYFTPHISILLCLFPLELSKLRIHLKFVRIFYSFHCDTSTKNASNMTSLEFILLLGFVSIRIRSNPFESVRIRSNPFESFPLSASEDILDLDIGPDRESGHLLTSLSKRISVRWQ